MYCTCISKDYNVEKQLNKGVDRQIHTCTCVYMYMYMYIAIHKAYFANKQLSCHPSRLSLPLHYPVVPKSWQCRCWMCGPLPLHHSQWCHPMWIEQCCLINSPSACEKAFVTSTAWSYLSLGSQTWLKEHSFESSGVITPTYKHCYCSAPYELYCICSHL